MKNQVTRNPERFLNLVTVDTMIVNPIIIIELFYPDISRYIHTHKTGVTKRNDTCITISKLYA